MLRALFVIFLIGSACCGFFDMMDVDDPLALLWNSRPSEPKLSECRVNTQSGVKYGVCTPHSNCILSGGAPHGFCGILSTCCVVEKTCGKTSSTKVGYFEGSEIRGGVSSCSYTVKLKNPNICQVRLDFVKFNLAPASAITDSQTQRVFKCIDDKLNIHPNHYNIPDLCGINDNQHVYVHINQSIGVVKGVQLEFTLADRTLYPKLQSPSWKIKVTQLECPGRKIGFNLPNDDYALDFPLLAPLGAIQYFTDAIGHIKSFGFGGSTLGQSYTFGQKYAIAFKREIHICGVKFTPEYINLPYDGDDFDAQCNHYIFVPDLYYEDVQQSANNLMSRVCTNAVFMSYAPGPLYVYFNSRETDINEDEEIQHGFNIKYELLNKCP